MSTTTNTAIINTTDYTMTYMSSYPGTSTTTVPSSIYQTFPIIHDVFTKLNDTFNLNLTEEQIKMLNELYNTNDDINQQIALEMFKTLLNGK